MQQLSLINFVYSSYCSRFFRFLLLLFVLHQMALGLFRMIATLARDMIIANTFSSAALLAIFLLGGFIVPKGKALKIWCNIVQLGGILTVILLLRYDQAMVGLGILGITIILCSGCSCC